MTSDKELEKVLSAIRKRYGDEVIKKGTAKTSVARIHTGSLVMDWLTGGGYPIGRWLHFYGDYASAKTLTALRFVREAQRAGKFCAYYDIENQFDPVWAQQIGIDLDKLEVIDATRIEDVGAIMESLLRVIDCHVVDSIGAAVSADELAGDIMDWNPGIGARAWGKALRRANDKFDTNKNTILLINHAKKEFGIRATEEPGGPKLINFYSSLNLHFRKSSWLFYDKAGILSPDGNKTDSLTGDTEPNGMEFVVRAAKSRIGDPNRVARFRIDFKSGEFDDIWVMAKAADYFGVVERSGSWYTLPDKETKVQGENGLREALLNNEDFRNSVISKVMADI